MPRLLLVSLVQSSFRLPPLAGTRDTGGGIGRRPRGARSSQKRKPQRVRSAASRESGDALAPEFRRIRIPGSNFGHAALALVGTLLTMAGCSTTSAQPPTRIDCAECIILVEGNVFDGSVAGPGTVVIRGQKVLDLHREGVEVVAGDIVDLSGHTILPGLLDLHVHLRPSAGPPSMADAGNSVKDHFKAFLRAGVTSVLDLGTERHIVFAYRQRIREGSLLAPSLLAAGPALTPTGGHPCYVGRPPFDLCDFTDEPMDGKRIVEDLAGDDPDVLKVVIESGSDTFPLPEMSTPVLESIQQSAEEVGIPIVAHVSKAADMVKALDAGVRFFAHLPVRDRIDAELANRLASTGAVVIPTLVVLDARLRAAFGQLHEVQGEEAMDDIPRYVVEAWRDPDRLGEVTKPEAQEEVKRRWENLLANFQICHEAGVILVAGTDAGNPATFHGLSLRRELMLYVEAGLSPIQALHSATRDAARALGLDDRGRIARGTRADLLVVRGDPTEDIAALGDVQWVYLEGERLDPANLILGKSYALERTTMESLGEGQTCLGDGECAVGLICTAYRWCRHECSSSACSKDRACFRLDSLSEAPYCEPGDGCDPVAQDCPNEVACIWLGSGVTRCWYPGKGKAGQACSPWGMCAPGHQCDNLSSLCVRLCDPTTSETGCEVEQTCMDRTSEAGVVIGECR